MKLEEASPEAALGHQPVKAVNKSKTKRKRSGLSERRPVGQTRKAKVPRRSQSAVEKLDESDQESDVFEVERVMGCKLIGGRVFYLIKWLGYDDSHTTWENEEDLVGARDCARDFVAQHGKPTVANPMTLSPKGLAWTKTDTDWRLRFESQRKITRFGAIPKEIFFFSLRCKFFIACSFLWDYV